MLAQSERDTIEVSDDLVAVSKERKDVGKADVTGIEIRVATDSPVPVAFRLVEQFPEVVSMDDLAVHPQFSPEKWTVSESERRMVFEDVVGPDEELVTLYGVLEAKYEDLEPFMGEPEIALSQQVDPGTTCDGGERLFRGGAASVEASAPTNGSINVERLLEKRAEPESSADARPDEPSDAEPSDAEPSDAELSDAEPSDADVSDASASDAELTDLEPSDFEPLGRSDPAPAGDETSEPSPEAPVADETFEFKMAGARADAGEAAAGSVEQPEPSSGTSGTPEPAGESIDLGNASVVSAFIDELEREELADEQLDAFREVLDLEPAESMELRVNHLQSEVASLSAYADEFERFVDGDGSFSGALDEFREEMNRVEAQVDDLSAHVGTAAEERAELRDHVDRLEEELDAFEESHESCVDRLSSRIDDVETEAVTAEEAAAIRNELGAERAWRRKVVESLEAFADNAADRHLEP